MRLRPALHGLAIVLGWVLFFWGWQRVFSGRPDFSELRELIVGAALVVPVVTLSWIAHNVGIYRRKGPRRAVPSATLEYGTDFNGRRVEADWAALAGAQCIDIVIDGGVKRYEVQRAMRRPPGGPT